MRVPTIEQRVQSALGEALWDLGARFRWHWAMRTGWALVNAQWRDTDTRTCECRGRSTQICDTCQGVEGVELFDQRDYDA